jgi:hypothetical protein
MPTIIPAATRSADGSKPQVRTTTPCFVADSLYFMEGLDGRGVGSVEGERHAHKEGRDEGACLVHGLAALRVQGSEGGGGGDAGREFELLVIDHLALHRHGDEDA